MCMMSVIRQNNDLKNHMLLHPGQKPDSFQVCCNTFRCKHNLNEPMLIYIGEMRNVCEVYNKAFRQKRGLNTQND
ncbi:hypothetical protein X975_17189, partial [Stegodyphus mimosarum]